MTPVAHRGMLAAEDSSHAGGLAHTGRALAATYRLRASWKEIVSSLNGNLKLN